MTTTVNDIANTHRTVAVASGATEHLDMRLAGFPATVTAVPGGGGSMQVFYSTTPSAFANPGAATWLAWPAGSVTVPTSDGVMSPITALRFTATGAAGVAEVAA